MQQTYKSVWNTHIPFSTKLHVRLYNTCILLIVLCIWMLGSHQSLRGTYRCFWSVVSQTSAWNYLAGPHHKHRGMRTHWYTCCQRGHISTKTVYARRPRRECHLQQTPTKQSTKIFRPTGGDDPRDLDSPGWLVYINICGNLTLTWTMFLNLLLIVYCGGVDLWRYAPLWCTLLMMMVFWATNTADKTNITSTL